MPDGLACAVSTGSPDDDLLNLLLQDAARPTPAPVAALAARLAIHGGPGVAAVIFYGSALRDVELDGVLDFYVLTDKPDDWPAPWLASTAGRWLPPNVGYLEQDIEGVRLRAKIAVMTLAQFTSGMSMHSVDTTLWARFSQRCLLSHVRSDADRSAVCQALALATMTASRWAAALGPSEGGPLAYWRALYQHTYRAELRVERSSRGVDIVARDAERYTQLLPLAWRAAGLDFETGGNGTEALRPHLDEAERRRQQARWRRRERLGRPLNVLRLLKAALTFDNAIDYVAWKVERHSGYRIEPSDFQRRHPLLAAPGLYLRLRSRKVLR